MLLADLRNLAAAIPNIGVLPDDTDDARLYKTLLVRASFMIIPAGVVWGAFYILLGETRAGLIPLSYSFLSQLSVVYFAITRRYRVFLNIQLVLILVAPFLLQVILGGFINSSAVVIWSLLCPLGALLFAEPRRAPFWFLLYLGVVLVCWLLQPYVRVENNLPPGVVLVFFAGNIGTVSAIVFSLLLFFVRQKNDVLRLLRQEQDKSERLLLNVLPKEIAPRLKNESRVIADQFEAASVLFADLVGFTPLSAVLSPEEMVEVLNTIYSSFDALVDQYGLEKIRTIGDNYMVAAGVPSPRTDHAHALAELALDMRAYLDRLPEYSGRRLKFRIGINSGPVIGGVIGRRKFTYDVWGDTVNIASRMESQGEAGKIQVTRATYHLIKDHFKFVPRGFLEVRGRGVMETWFLDGSRNGSS